MPTTWADGQVRACLLYTSYTPEKEAKYPTSFKVDFVGQPYEGACYYRIKMCIRDRCRS